MAELCKGRGQGNVQCQTRLVRDASLSCGPSLLTASNTLQEDRRRSCMSDASLPVIVTHPDNGASRREDEEEAPITPPPPPPRQIPLPPLRSASVVDPDGGARVLMREDLVLHVVYPDGSTLLQ
eukprot:scaffold46813_cov38-Tisochrysis_lutea.AAC.1